MSTVAKAMKNKGEVIWIPDDEENFYMKPQTDASNFSTCAHLVGGGVGGVAWTEACQKEKALLPPLVHLKRGLDQDLEMCIHKSGASGPIAVGIGVCLRAAEQESVVTGWKFRPKRSAMQLGSRLQHTVPDVVSKLQQMKTYLPVRKRKSGLVLVNKQYMHKMKQHPSKHRGTGILDHVLLAQCPSQCT